MEANDDNISDYIKEQAQNMAKKNSEIENTNNKEEDFKASISTLFESRRVNDEKNQQDFQNDKQKNLEVMQINQSGCDKLKITPSFDEKISLNQNLNNPYLKDENKNISENIGEEMNERNEIKETAINKINNNIKSIEDTNNFPNNESINLNTSNSNSIPLYSQKKFTNLKYKSDTQKENTLTKKYLLNCFNDKDKTKMLQSMIRQEASEDIIEKIINELINTYKYVMKNKNGNYFLKELIQVCKPSHRIIILKEIYKTISEDCCDKFAKYPIQELIDYSNSKEEYLLILYSFDDYNKTLLASVDPNGSYVIQKIISHIPEKHKKKFNLIFVSFIYFIVNKRFGVVNAKLFVDKIKDDDLLDKILDLIRANFMEISTGQFGNYFIQHILEKWYNTNQGEIIKEIIIYKFRELIINKYGSHICDLYLKLANLKEITHLMNILNLNLNNNLNDGDVDKVIMVRIMNKLQQNLVINQNINNSKNRNTNKNKNHNNNANNINNNFSGNGNFNTQNSNFNYNSMNNNFFGNINNQNNMNNNFCGNLSNQNNMNNNSCGNMNNQNNINNNNFPVNNINNNNFPVNFNNQNNFNNNFNFANNNYNNINNNIGANFNHQNNNNFNYNNINNNFNNNIGNNQFNNTNQYQLSMNNFNNNNNDSNFIQNFPLSLNNCGNNNNNQYNE